MSGAASEAIIVLVAAVGENNVIGRDNQLPWRMPSDLKHFRALTINKPVVMGRKTFESIGKPLQDRTNIVVTRDRRFAADGVIVAHNLDAALALARADAQQRGGNEVMVIGGNAVFIEALAHADRLEITHVHAAPEGDVVFPAIDPVIWRETARIEHRAGPQDSADFATARYERAVLEPSL